MIKTPSEDHEQMMFVQWFRREFQDVVIFAIPNGGARHPAVAAKLKATGVLPGVPDLFVPRWNLWIEMKKVKGGKTSDYQKKMIAYLNSVGHHVLVCRGCSDASEQMLNFLKTTKPFL